MSPRRDGQILDEAMTLGEWTRANGYSQTTGYAAESKTGSAAKPREHPATVDVVVGRKVA